MTGLDLCFAWAALLRKAVTEKCWNLIYILASIVRWRPEGLACLLAGARVRGGRTVVEWAFTQSRIPVSESE